LLPFHVESVAKVSLQSLIPNNEIVNNVLYVFPDMRPKVPASTQRIVNTIGTITTVTCAALRLIGKEFGRYPSTSFPL